MSILVYFIGGSRDLSKQVLQADAPPPTIECAQHVVVATPFARAINTQLDREVYRLRGSAYSARRYRDVWIYAVDE